MTNAFRVKNICETKKVLELTGFEDVKHKYLYPFILTQMKGKIKDDQQKNGRLNKSS